MIKSEKKVLFSIVVPVWNRQDVIGRCLDSVFSQDFDDYEVVVVDDASEDNTVSVIKKYSDPRLKFIRQPVNHGVCAARAVATAAAKGKWILKLDSDWELLPGALKFLAEKAVEVPADVGVIGGYTRTDQGEIWPVQPFPEGLFGFVEWLKITDTSLPTDYLPCIRIEVFDSNPWPTDRRLESQHVLRLAKAWKTWIWRKVLSVAYTNDANRITQDVSQGAMERRLIMARDQATCYEEILEEFGLDFKMHSPRRYWQFVNLAAKNNFLAGRRLRGLKFGLRAWLHRPWSVRILFIIAGGLLFGPKAWVWKSRFRSGSLNRSGKFLR